TALTRMLHQGATYTGYPVPSALAAEVPRLLRERRGQPTYVYGYWSSVDHVGHVRGPLSEEHDAEVAALDSTLGLLLRWLPQDGRTLLLVTADHGQMSTSQHEQVKLEHYPQVLALLRAQPA